MASEDGTITPGLIEQVSLPKSDRSEFSAKQVTYSEYVAQSINSLISSGLAPDLDGALKVSEKLSLDQLDTFVEARVESLKQSNPEMRQEIEKQEARQRFSEKLRKGDTPWADMNFANIPIPLANS
jgi:hypothetical protein